MLKKTVLTMATVGVVVLGSAFFAESVHADTINDLHNKQSKIQDERSDIKANLSEAESEIADVLIDLEELNEEIDRVDEALKLNQKAMEDTEEDISATEEEVDELEKEIAVLQEAIDKRYDILKERVVAFQKNGGNIGYLDVIFGSKSFGEFISRVSAVSKITDSDKDLMDQQEADKEKVVEQQEVVENKLAELNDMKVELVGMEVLIKDQKEQNEKKKTELKTKEKELVALKDELQIKDGNLASLEAEVRRSIAAKRTPVVSNSSSTNSGNGGKLTTLSSPSTSKGSFSNAINAGKTVMGVPYVSAGKGPSGFDCSGFVSWAFAQAGYSMPSSTAALQNVGTKIPYSQAQPGDLIFFDTYKKNGHVGIYLGGGRFLGAQNSTGVAIAYVNDPYYWSKKFSGHVRRVN